MQEFFQDEYPTRTASTGTSSPGTQQQDAPALSVNKKAAEKKRKRRSGKTHKIQNMAEESTLLAADARQLEDLESVDTKAPFTTYNTEEQWTLYDPSGAQHQADLNFQVSVLSHTAFCLNRRHTVLVPRNARYVLGYSKSHHSRLLPRTPKACFRPRGIRH